jgi:ATP-dependent protease ClpP protease subunit
LIEEPNFENYTIDELQDAYNYIDKVAYPERTKKLKEEIEIRLKAEQLMDEQSPPVNSLDEEYQIPEGNWFNLHWRGLLPLDLSYWVNVFAIGLILLFLSPPLFQYLADSDASPAVRGSIIITFYIFVTCVSVWQLTGLYRSADKHTSRGGSAGWAMLAKLMVLIGIARYCYDMKQTGVPFILESSKLVVGTSQLPALSIRIMNQGTEVELLGGLEFGASKNLAQVLIDNPSVRIIHLNSMGGRIAEAKKLALLVKKNKLITYSKTLCLSACPIVFLAGKEKLLGDSAKLGFHSASFGGVSGSEVEELNKSLLSQLGKANVSSWFIKKVSKVSSEEVWNPSTDELIKAGVIDKVVDSGNYALSGVDDWQNPTTIDQELQKHEVYKSLNQFDKEAYKVVRDRMVTGIKDGTPLNTITTIVNHYIYVERLNHYMQLGGDEEVIRYMESQISQMEYLKADYPAKCASYTYPEVFDSNIANDIPSLLPSEVSEMETIAFNSLIKSLTPENYIVDKNEQATIITGVVGKMIAVDSSYGDVLSNPTKYRKEPEKLCTVGIMLNKEIIALSKEKAGSLLRSFYLTEK